MVRPMGPDETQTVTVTATDSEGEQSSVDFQLNVNNVAPSVSADDDPVSVVEGDTATNTGSFSDPGDDTVAITASIGTISQVGSNSGTWSWSFGTTDGPDQSQTVIVTATDSDGAFSTTSFVLEVANDPPQIEADADVVEVDEGDEATNSGIGSWTSATMSSL